MLHKLTLFIFLTFTTFNIFAQQNTYWQQKVDCKIDVKLNDSTNTLSGYITINYRNNSPDTLNFIYFHLYPNAYKDETTVLCQQLLNQGNTSLYFAADSSKGFIDSLNFLSNNEKLNWNYDSQYSDVAKIILNKPLNPGENVIIETPFFVKIPSSQFSRLGHYLHSYQITQWYPKPVVYDAKGWHAFHYLNQGEFYSDFGNYDVNITLPSNYVVGATGDLQNKDEDNWMDSIANATKKITTFGNSLNFPPSSKKYKTLHFKQDSVHDFAWFADKRYYVLRSEITLKNGHKVKTQVLFTNEEADLWTKGLLYIDQALNLYSEKVGYYPYNQVTAVQGTISAGGGMEYPTITIIGVSNYAKGLQTTIVHEVGHNWFYGILGFNERDYPWMDEGINSYYQDICVQQNKIPKQNGWQNKISYFTDSINDLATQQLSNLLISNNLNQASTLTSEAYTSMGYDICVYINTAKYFDMLEKYLGQEKFDNTMRQFYDTWKFKHPQPEDFKLFFEQKTQKDLSWFFNDILGSTKKNDYKICTVKTATDSVNISIKNIGEIKAPIIITGFDNNKKPINSWIFDGFSGKQNISIPNQNFNEIVVNEPNSFSDRTPQNNFYYPNRTFPKARIPSLKFIIANPKPENTYLYFTPIIGWNLYNKFMFGALFFNHSFIEKKWEYELMPLYSVNTNNWNGFFGFHRNFYPKNNIQRISIGVTGKKYNYKFDNHSYRRLVPELTIYFKSAPQITYIQNIFKLRFIYLEKDFTQYIPQNSIYVKQLATSYLSLFDVNYTYQNNRKINPFGASFNTQINKNIFKSDVQFNYTITYQKPKKGLYVNVFLGNIFSSNQSDGVDYSYKLSSWNGLNDYLCDYTYLGRGETTGILSAQTTPHDGGFYLPSALGRSWGFIGAVNLKTSLPFTNIVKLYANLGTTVNPNMNKPAGKEPFLYEAGAMFSILKGNFEIYFPIIFSKEYKDNMSLDPNHSYINNIRFTMKLDFFNPSKLKELHL